MLPRSNRVNQFLVCGLGVLAALTAYPARAEVVRFDITSREPYADGHKFGKVGAYEQIVGRVDFAIDPTDPANQDIVDLRLAPRNTEGKVEFHCDLFVLVPRDSRRGNGAILYDVNNRGNKLALKFFNDSADGNAAKDAGHAFLFWRGYTIVWSGWDGELLPGDGRLRLFAPVARKENSPVTGPVRYEICPDKEDVERIVDRQRERAEPLFAKEQ